MKQECVLHVNAQGFFKHKKNSIQELCWLISSGMMMIHWESRHRWQFFNGRQNSGEQNTAKNHQIRFHETMGLKS